VEKALSYLGASQIKSGAFPIVFNNETATDLFSAYVGVFFAERVQKGFSLLKDRLGETIANPIVTLRDDGICSAGSWKELKPLFRF
jgi:PmbA protein